MRGREGEVGEVKWKGAPHCGMFYIFLLGREGGRKCSGEGGRKGE